MFKNSHYGYNVNNGQGMSANMKDSEVRRKLNLGKAQVNKEIADTLDRLYKTWRHAADNRLANTNAASQSLNNYIKSNAADIAEGLAAVAILEQKIASYEELIKSLTASKKTKIGTPADAEVQTAVVDAESDTN